MPHLLFFAPTMAVFDHPVVMVPYHNEYGIFFHEILQCDRQDHAARIHVSSVNIFQLFARDIRRQSRPIILGILCVSTMPGEEDNNQPIQYKLRYAFTVMYM